ADFITCVAFGKVALNLSKYCGKGSQISLEGKVQSFSYDKNGETKFGMNVVANNIQFLSHPQNDQEQGQDKNNSDEPSGDSSSRSEEHTSELQSRFDLVCRLLLEKKKK